MDVDVVERSGSPAASSSSVELSATTPGALAAALPRPLEGQPVMDVDDDPEARPAQPGESVAPGGGCGGSPVSPAPTAGARGRCGSGSERHASGGEDDEEVEEVRIFDRVADAKKSRSPSTSPSPKRCSGSLTAFTSAAAAVSGSVALKRAIREHEKQRRLNGKLIDLTLRDLAVVRGSQCDFFVENVVVCVRGAHSQFDSFVGRLKRLMPPVTNDSCQTFSTVSAVLLSSLGLTVLMEECCNTSTVNYLLYIAAWLHQLTMPAWPRRGARPTIDDLNTCLAFHNFFPSLIEKSAEFDVVFYYQRDRAMQLIRELCLPREKRQRDAEHRPPVRGYVIVSGDYTVSIFSLRHDIQCRTPAASKYADAWSLYICDSHGTQPWAYGKASITGVSFGERVEPPPPGSPQSQSQPGQLSPGGDDNHERAELHLLSFEEGLRYFSLILFALLEDHRSTRRDAPQANTPYMTWTPIRRPNGVMKTADELKTVIDTKWLPHVLSQQLVRDEAAKFEFRPLECFWGLSTRRTISQVAAPQR